MVPTICWGVTVKPSYFWWKGMRRWCESTISKLLCFLLLTAFHQPSCVLNLLSVIPRALCKSKLLRPAAHPSPVESTLLAHLTPWCVFHCQCKVFSYIRGLPPKKTLWKWTDLIISDTLSESTHSLQKCSKLDLLYGSTYMYLDALWSWGRTYMPSHLHHPQKATWPEWHSWSDLMTQGFNPARHPCKPCSSGFTWLKTSVLCPLPTCNTDKHLFWWTYGNCIIFASLLFSTASQGSSVHPSCHGHGE